MSVEPLVSELADDEDMADLLREFVQDLDVKCANIRQALQSNDLATLARMGHQLKGSGGGYGYPALSAAGAALETETNRSPQVTDQLRTIAGELLHLCERVKAGVIR